MKYKLNAENPSTWGTEAYNGRIIDEDEVKWLAHEWNKSVDKLLEELEELDVD